MKVSASLMEPSLAFCVNGRRMPSTADEVFAETSRAASASGRERKNRLDCESFIGPWYASPMTRPRNWAATPAFIAEMKDAQARRRATRAVAGPGDGLRPRAEAYE